ncbi:hypothetical protein [Vibrio sp. PNB22_8_1]|uniref:hypothetical protein n=1 Tax=unclassified Vibrio TaxID=2614977 RepID=UPI00406A0D23
MSVIKVKTEQFEKSYHDEILPPAFLKQSSDCDFSQSLLTFSCDDLIAEIEQAQLTLLLAAHELREPSVVRALMDKADSGVRVYILLGEGDSQAAIEALSERCLVCQTSAQNGALLLRDHATNKAKGWVLTDHRPFCSEQISAWSLALEWQQIEDGFRSFCKLFWQPENREYVKQNQEHKGKAHPDGDVITNHAYQQTGQLSNSLVSSLSHIQSRSVSADGTAIYDAIETAHQVLLPVDVYEEIAENHVALTDRQIPSLLLSEHDAWLLTDEPNTTQINWCLRLSKQQSDQLKQAYGQAFNDAAWQYESSPVMHQLPAGQKIRFADQVDQVKQISAQQAYQLEPIYTDSMESFINDSAQCLTEKQTQWRPKFLAQICYFEVQIHPPYCPDNAKPDPLYQQWQSTQSDWLNRLATLKRSQQQIDTQQDSLKEKFSRFVNQFILGEQRTVRKLNEEIAQLEQWLIADATPSEREQHRDRLQGLTQAIAKRSKDTVTKLDEAEQQLAWEQKKQALEKQYQQAKQAQETALRDWQALQDLTQQKENDAARAFVEQWQDAVEKLDSEALTKLKFDALQLEQFLSAEKLEDDELQKAKEAQAKQEYLLEKRQRLAKMDHQAAYDWQQASVKEKVLAKHYSDLDKALKNHRYALEKITRDLKTAEKAYHSAEKASAQGEQALHDHGVVFKYKPQSGSSKHLDKQLGLKSNRATQTSFDWPNEDLPAETSELRTVGKQRWLVVSEQKDLPKAHDDARRLNAKICVDRQKSPGRSQQQ